MQSSAPAIRRANGINLNGTNSPPIKKHSDGSQRHFHRHYRSQNNNLGEISDHESIGNLSSNSNSVRQYGSIFENLEKNPNDNRLSKKSLSNRQASPLISARQQFFEQQVLINGDLVPIRRNGECLSSVQDISDNENSNNNYSQKVIKVKKKL